MDALEEGCGSDEAGEDYETALRRADAVRAAEGLPAYTAYSRGIGWLTRLRESWRARKVPVRNSKYPPRQAWEVNPSLRALIEGK